MASIMQIILYPFVKYMISCQYDYIRLHTRSLDRQIFFPDDDLRKMKIINHQVKPITNLIL
jgi:hypothetical protein